MHKIVTPVSHLFFNKKNAEKISKNSDHLEIRERTLNLSFKNEKFFHCDDDLTLPWSKDFKNQFEQIIKRKKYLKYITFQATRCCANAKIVNKVFIVSGKIFSRKEMLNEAKKNTQWLRKKFGNMFRIGLENNNYYPTKAYDVIADADFISQVVRENKLFFLFDLAHAQVTASNKKINYQEYLESLPMDLMLQMHICRPRIDKKISRDTHYLPNKKMFKEVKLLANKYKNLKFFTIEYYKDTKKLINNINSLKKILQSKS
jgi:hypothetical protein